jgi:hypothetical protein
MIKVFSINGFDESIEITDYKGKNHVIFTDEHCAREDIKLAEIIHDLCINKQMDGCHGR